MNRIQNVVCKLLGEIDEICRRHDIEYSLAEKTALMAIEEGRFTNDEYLAELVMTADNYKKFLNVCKNELSENRILENAYNNPRIDGAYSRYVATDTTLIDFRIGRQHKYKGIHVVIRPIVSFKPTSLVQKTRRATVKANSKGYISSEMKYCGKKRRLKLQALMALRPVFGNPRKYLEECVNAEPGSFYYYNGFKDRVSVKKSLIKGYTDIEFEGLTLRCFKNRKAWAELMTSNKRNKSLGVSSYAFGDFGIVADPYIPFEELIDDCKKKGLYSDQTFETYGEYKNYKTLVHDPRDKKIMKDWQYVRRTRHRFELWCYYEDKIDDIKAAYEAGNEEYAREELKLYIDNILLYHKKGLGFSIDRDLFEICMGILKKDGKGKTAAAVRKSLPKEYSETVGEFLAREGYTR